MNVELSRIGGTRKRVLSSSGASFTAERKRPRLSDGSTATNESPSVLNVDGYSRMSRHMYDEPGASGSVSSIGRNNSISHLSRPLSRTSSFTSNSRAATPGHLSFPYPSVSAHTSGSAISKSIPLPTSRARSLAKSASMSLSMENADPVISKGMALMRSASCASLNESGVTTPGTQQYSEISAIHYLKNSKMTVDFAVVDSASASTTSGATTVGAGVFGGIHAAGGATTNPTTSGTPNTRAKHSPLPVSWSSQNLLFFSRGNRVHYKNMSNTDQTPIAQLCKLSESKGNLTDLRCAGPDQPNVIALATSKGFIQIYDAATKKSVLSWSTKGVASMAWNGPVLSVGGDKGTIRHYDTRIKDSGKMKEQSRKVTRHQSQISSLGWNSEGKLLASGDCGGTVLVWDSRQSVPLDVGELIQRRKKMQHEGVISSIAWCPWLPKLFASGDAADNGSGTIRLWNVNDTSPYSNAAVPGKIILDSQITSLYFSPHCKEILSTHGSGPPTTVGSNTFTTSDNNDPFSSNIIMNMQQIPWPRMNTACSIAIHSYPSLRHVTTARATDDGVGIANSFLSPNGQKLALAFPADGKLKMWDVWGKRKEVKRQPSFMDQTGIR